MGVYVVKVCNASVFGGCTSFMLTRLCFGWSDSFEIDFVVGGFAGGLSCGLVLSCLLLVFYLLCLWIFLV